MSVDDPAGRHASGMLNRPPGSTMEPVSDACRTLSTHELYADVAAAFVG